MPCKSSDKLAREKEVGRQHQSEYTATHRRRVQRHTKERDILTSRAAVRTLLAWKDSDKTFGGTESERMHPYSIVSDTLHVPHTNVQLGMSLRILFRLTTRFIGYLTIYHTAKE